jgi:hypothetical protein
MNPAQKAIQAHLLGTGGTQTPALHAMFAPGLSLETFRARLQKMAHLGLIRNARQARNLPGRWVAIEQAPKAAPAGQPLPGRSYDVMRAPLLVAPVMYAARQGAAA